jgi:hypothetical protein
MSPLKIKIPAFHRFFKNAVGFVSPHGAAFANVIFMTKNPSIVLQIKPQSPNSMDGPAEGFYEMAANLGHSVWNITANSTGETRWDMYYNEANFVKLMCSEHKIFDKVWSMKKNLYKKCKLYNLGY